MSENVLVIIRDWNAGSLDRISGMPPGTLAWAPSSFLHAEPGDVFTLVTKEGQTTFPGAVENCLPMTEFLKRRPMEDFWSAARVEIDGNAVFLNRWGTEGAVFNSIPFRFESLGELRHFLTALPDLQAGVRVAHFFRDGI